MEKIIETPEEEWDEQSKLWLFAWVEWVMSMPKNQLRVYGRVLDVPPPEIESGSEL